MSADPAFSGRNSPPSEELLSFIQRIERVREDKQSFSDDESAIFAEAKATGFDTKAMRRVLKVRQMKPHDRDEMDALDDIYRQAVGLARDLPLFRSVAAMSIDRAARDSVVAALKLLVPDSGEIVITVGGQSTRLWRDDKGAAQAEEQHELPLQPERREKERRDARPDRPKPDAPDVDDEAATELGRQAARDNVAVVRNPFPWDDERRRLWDAGWREVAGSDGMGPDE